MILWLAVALAHGAGGAAEAVVTAANQGNAGDHAAAIATLDGVIAKRPEFLDARVVRGVFRYLSGDLDGARGDLGHALSAEKFTEVTRTSADLSEVTTETTTVDIGALRVVGAAMLVVLHVREDRLDAARAVLARARTAFGDAPPLLAASARLQLAAGDAGAWSTLERALDRPDEGRFALSVASEMVALAPSAATPTVKAALAATGQWTVDYNAARAHLAARRFDACVATIVDALTRHDEPELVGLGYTCAARADLARAEVWLAALGGPAKAEPADVLAHGRTLSAGGRPDEALTLVEALPRDLTPAHATARTALRLQVHLDAGRLDDALRVADGSVPELETRLAHALVTGGRKGEARKLLARACPALAGKPGQAACIELRDYVDQLR